MDQKSISTFPTIVAYPLHNYLKETNPVLRLWAACDAVEMTLRLLVMLGASDLRRSSPELPEPLLKELRSRIEEPTLGKWRGMAEAIAKHLPGDTMVPEMKPWVELLGLFLDGSKPESSETSFRALRNRLSHGGGVTKEAAGRLLQTWEPKFAALIGGLSNLSKFALVVEDADGSLAELRGPSLTLQPYTPATAVQEALKIAFGNHENVVFVHGDRAAPLWPLELYGVPRHPDPNMVRAAVAVPQIYVRRGAVSLQMTPIGSEVVESVSDEAGLALFRELFRLDEPVRHDHDAQPFAVPEKGIRDDAAQLFGRTAELEEIRAQMSAATQGVFWLFGKAGIGKSYVMAKLAVDWLEAHNTEDELTLAYRFRIGGDAGCSQEAFLRFAVDHLEAFLQVGKKGGDLRARLHTLLAQCGPKKVWFLLDGLDELIQRDPRFPEEVVFGAPSLPNVVWLCAGQPRAELQNAFRPDRCRLVFDEGLPLMSDGDIRTLLVENINGSAHLRKQLLKGDVEEADSIRNPFIDLVAKHAAGLPLYVRYVINDIKRGHYRVLDVGEAVPESLDAYHAVLLKRLGIGMLAQVLTPMVATLAAAREPLPVGTIADLLTRRDLVEEGEAGTQQITEALRAVETMIRRAVTPEGRAGYTLYHDSLRQHMLTNKDVAPAVRLSVQSLRRWCADWSNHKSPYALRQLAEHLSSAQEWTALFALADNEAFLQAQAVGLPRDPDAPLRTLRTALQAAIDSKDAFHMAKYVLHHAERVVVLQQESPLSALNPEDLTTLTRAWELADLFPIADNVLWHLLLPWRLKRNGKTEAARETLERLGNIIERQKTPHEIITENGHQTHIVLFGLFEAMTISSTVTALLAERLLNSKNMHHFCHRLIVEDNFIDDALSLARDIPDEQFRSKALAAVASALANMGRGSQADAAFEQALDIARGIPHKRLGSEALAAVASALTATGRGSQALGIARGISDKWFRSSVLIAIVSALANAGRGSQTDAAFEQALDVARGIPHKWLRSEALAAVASALANAGRGDQADAVLEQALKITKGVSYTKSIPYRFGKCQGFIAIASALAVAGRGSEALDIAQSLLPLSDERCQPRALAAIASALAVAGRDSEALDIARSLPEDPYQSEALFTIVSALVNTRRGSQTDAAFEQALDVARGIPDERLRSEALAAVASALANMGRGSQADAAFEQALDIARSFPFPLEQYQYLALAAIASALAVAGRDSEALDIARGLPDKWYQSKALVAVASALANAGRGSQAGTDFEQALGIARGIPDERLRSEALAAVASALANAGRGDQADAAFEQALDIARRHPGPDWQDSCQTLVAIASALAVAGRDSEALDIARSLPEPYTSEALVAMASALANAGRGSQAGTDFEQALDIAQSIPYPQQQSQALAAIATALANTGRDSQAGTDFEQALGIARGIPDERLRSEALAAVASALANAGRGDQADAAFEQALDIARNLPLYAQSFQVEALATIATALANAGRSSQADAIIKQGLDITQSLPSYSQSSSLEVISQCTLSESLNNAVANFAGTLLTDREQSLCEIVTALSQHGNSVAVHRLLIPCASYISTAYSACSGLALLYPDQAVKIAELLIGDEGR